MSDKNNTNKTVLVMFDVSDDKRRRKITKLLESYGTRIQESVFECRISVYSIRTLWSKMVRCLDMAEDKLRLYQLTQQNKVLSFGIETEETYLYSSCFVVI